MIDPEDTDPGQGIFNVQWDATLTGVLSRSDGPIDTDRTDLTFGAGVGAAGIAADYAFVGHNDTVGDTHRFTLSLRF